MVRWINNPYDSWHSAAGVHGACKLDVKKRYAEGLERHAVWFTKRGTSDPGLSTEELLGLERGEHLEKSTSVITAAGTTNVKLVESYKGVPVIGKSVVIETENGELTGEITGHLIKGIVDDIPDTDPLLDKDDALDIAAESLGDELEHILDGTFEIVLEIFVEDEENSPDVIPTLVYQLSYMTIEEGSASIPTFIIDANTGGISQYNIITCNNANNQL